MKTSSQKTYDRLKAKANSRFLEKQRMPSLKKIAELLEDLNIPHSYMDISKHKDSKPSGMNYFTSGGTREYKGGWLQIFKEKGSSVKIIEIDSTDSYYSYNTAGYAEKIIKHIDEKMKDKQQAPELKTDNHKSFDLTKKYKSIPYLYLSPENKKDSYSSWTANFYKITLEKKGDEKWYFNISKHSQQIYSFVYKTHLDALFLGAEWIVQNLPSKDHRSCIKKTDYNLTREDNILLFKELLKKAQDNLHSMFFKWRLLDDGNNKSFIAIYFDIDTYNYRGLDDSGKRIFFELDEKVIMSNELNVKIKRTDWTITVASKRSYHSEMQYDLTHAQVKSYFNRYLKKAKELQNSEELVSISSGDGIPKTDIAFKDLVPKFDIKDLKVGDIIEVKYHTQKESQKAKVINLEGYKSNEIGVALNMPERALETPEKFDKDGFTLGGTYQYESEYFYKKLPAPEPAPEKTVFKQHKSLSSALRVEIEQLKDAIKGLQQLIDISEGNVKKKLQKSLNELKSKNSDVLVSYSPYLIVYSLVDDDEDLEIPLNTKKELNDKMEFLWKGNKRFIDETGEPFYSKIFAFKVDSEGYKEGLNHKYVIIGE